MTLTDPFWLVLAIPLAMSLWLWPLPSRLMLACGASPRRLLLLALCGLSVRLPVRSGTVVLVADRSLSMPPGSDALQKEAADIVHSAMRSGDKLAVVSFAETAAVEQSPQAGKFAGFSAEVGREASQLADALDLALSLVDRDEPGANPGPLRRPVDRPRRLVCRPRGPRRPAWPSTTGPSSVRRPAIWPSSASKGPNRSCPASRS